MLRFFRLRRNIFSLGARVNPRRPIQPEVVRIQRVKFRWRRPKVSEVLVPLGACYVFYEILTRALVVLIDEADIELTEEERKELEEDEDEPIFIPFPGFTYSVEPPPYQGTDPEWRAYIRVSQNRELLASIRGGLAEMARLAVAKHPRLGARKGQDVRISKYWLDVQYPLRPPPTFVRKGLSLGGGDGITWTEQPVDSVAFFWTRQALWPSAVSLSFWSFTSALLTQNAMTVARFFGYEPPSDGLANMKQAMERVQQQLKKAPPLPSQGRTGEGSATSSLPPVDERSAGSTRTPETMSTGAGMDNALPTVPSAKDMYMIRATQEHTSGPWASFKRSLAQKWRPAPAYPPRGSIRVSGLVEVNTSQAMFTVDCMAWWDPQTEQFDPKTVVLQLRAIRPRLQNPLRTWNQEALMSWRQSIGCYDYLPLLDLGVLRRELNRRGIPKRAQTTDDSNSFVLEVAMMAKRLARMHVADVQLDEGDVYA
ncbi:hypothetical protein NUW58_g8933 [Xylaria curta]|uniref:Uncharacterized protein n=1 Tax=Xylaria curta TaxID=42375 RepID=A0ACC1N371_9PEZI|nr:hypothetical protein NUW58_g8933 [Xylaria curta]